MSWDCLKNCSGEGMSARDFEMLEDSIKPSMLTPAQRRRIFGAIKSAVRQTFQYPMPPNLPEYPDSIPDIDDHIDRLVQVVRGCEPEARASEIVKLFCPACPHQFPSRYCPLQARGGCVLYRCAEPIAQTIAATLDGLDLERSGSLVS